MIYKLLIKSTCSDNNFSNIFFSPIASSSKKMEFMIIQFMMIHKLRTEYFQQILQIFKENHVTHMLDS